VIRLSKDEEERADRIALRKGLSRAAYIRLALMERIHLDEADPRLRALRPLRSSQSKSPPRRG
jgi:predicted DNA-binding protein